MPFGWDGLSCIADDVTFLMGTAFVEIFSFTHAQWPIKTDRVITSISLLRSIGFGRYFYFLLATSNQIKVLVYRTGS